MDAESRCSGVSVDWHQAELLFAHPNAASYATAIETAAAQGNTRFRLHPGGEPALREAVSAIIESHLGPTALAEGDAVGCAQVHFDARPETCSAELMSYVDRPATIIAPRTAHHASNRAIFLVAIPKSGFHLVSRVLSDMGIAHGGRWTGTPVANCWHTLYYDHPHLPATDLFAKLSAEERGGVDSAIFRHPVVFCYRHPADIAVSEARYYAERDATALAHYFSALPFERRLLELISDTGVVGTLRDRVASYREWMELPNVIPIAFEEIVGEAGGGTSALQLATLWALQLKLHVAGRPQEFARHLFGERNRTFRSGRIGGFQDVFGPAHVEALLSLERTDFLDNFGYRFDMADPGSALPARSAELRTRPLTFPGPADSAGSEPDTDIPLEDETLYRWHGYHVGRVRGRYCAIEPGQPRFDPYRDDPEARWFLASRADALGRMLAAAPLADEPDPVPAAEAAYEDVFRTRLVVHMLDPDLNQHALVRVGKRYIGAPHGQGELDLGEIDLERQPQLIVGLDREEVTARIRAVPLPPRLALGGYHGHNIVEYTGTYYAIPIALGAVDLEQAEHRDDPVIPRDGDLEALKARLVSATADHPEDGLPRLVREGYYGFNILRFAGAYHAIPQVAGAVDLTVRDPSTVPGSRSAPTQEALERRLADDLVAPAAPCPPFPSAGGDESLAAALRWAIDRLETHGQRVTRSEIGIGDLKAEIALLRRTLERMLNAEPSPPQPSGEEKA